MNPDPWRALHRNEWLSGPCRGPMSDNDDAVLASAGLADYVQSARRPLMVWHVRDSARQPGFVIPEEWPP